MLLVVLLMLAFLKTRKGADTNNIDLSHINQDSFQNYAKFYGNIIPTDANFDQKMNQIYLLITDSKKIDKKEDNYFKELTQ